MKRTSVALVIISFFVLSAYAGGLFGPSTYDECMLNSMKGRPQYMLSAVQDDCTSRFCIHDKNIKEFTGWENWYYTKLRGQYVYYWCK
jgi:hypothetical protein